VCIYIYTQAPLPYPLFPTQKHLVLLETRHLDSKRRFLIRFIKDFLKKVKFCLQSHIRELSLIGTS